MIAKDTGCLLPVSSMFIPYRIWFYFLVFLKLFRILIFQFLSCITLQPVYIIFDILVLFSNVCSILFDDVSATVAFLGRKFWR